METPQQPEPFQPTWESLSNYSVPPWFMDAKLGIFIHWGVYAVPAFFDEWYPKHMYNPEHAVFEHHRTTWGPQSEFGHKDFIPMFGGERWDPLAWVDLFERCGARYIVPVAEHHDGFPMYDCPFTDWNAAKMGPRRDVVAELAQLVRARGLKLGVSSHRALNWGYYNHVEDFDTTDAVYAGLYGRTHPEDARPPEDFIQDWFARTKDLIDRFQPDVLWFDAGWHEEEYAPYRPQVAAYYYNRALEWDRGVVLNYKEKFPDGTAVLDIERGRLDGIREDYWQTDTSVSYKSWCYIEDDDFRSVPSIVHDLVDVVSKNGNLLLSVGPRADGTIPEEATELLLGLGEWLEVNGEAIYGTRPWHMFGEGPTGPPKQFQEKEQQPHTARDVRFTTKGDTLYATCLGWPENGRFEITRLADEAIASISMLGSSEPISWSKEAKSLVINAPESRPCEHAYSFRIQLEK